MGSIGQHGLSEERAWAVALEKVRSLERRWEDPLARARELLALRNWLSSVEGVPRLSALSRLVAEGMDRRAFECVAVPVERAAARRRVTDIQILSADLPADAPPPGATMPLTLVADSLRSAFNIGGIFRSAECFGAGAIWLCGYSSTPDMPHVAEAALGAEALVPWREAGSVRDAIRELRGGGVRVLALETAEGAVPIERFSWTFPSALVLGNERFGLDPEVVAACDGCLAIPMFGRKNSLNVATAAAIALHAARTAFEQDGRPLS
jgi:tRNA G18 (ribose-2'-O)-methylase SpoU